MSDTEYSKEQIDLLLGEQKKSTQMLLRRDFQLSRANEELRALDKEKSEFVSIAAHQLRTPLSAIRWAQQMLLDGEFGELNDEQIHMLNQSQQSIARMVNLVNDLLSADHLEFGQVVYTKSDTPIGNVIKEITSELQPMAEERGITLNVEIPEEQIISHCDAEKLTEVFSNLINNAIKYTPNRGMVQIFVAKEEKNVVTKVTDSGIGIPKRDFSRIFNKFSRADNAKKIDANGSGLGLFIAKKIIEAHDGTISFESVEGSGTTFIVTLPLV